MKNKEIRVNLNETKIEDIYWYTKHAVYCYTHIVIYHKLVKWGFQF